MADLTWPAGLVPNESSMTLMENTASYENPLTGTVTTLERPGARWSQTLSFRFKTEDERAALQAYLVSLRGQANRAVLPVFGHTNRGTGGGTPLVNGASQTGSSLITDGWTATSVVLKAGDFFSVNGELKMVTADCVSDASGNATINFAPILRSSPADNAALTLGSDYLAPTELLTNGGFESGTLSSWATGAGASSVIAVSDARRSGSYGAEVGLALNASEILFYQGSIPLDDSTKTARVSAYARRDEDDLPNRNLWMVVNVFDAVSGGVLIATAATTSQASFGTSGHQLIEATFSVPAGTRRAEVYVLKYPPHNTDETGTWFVDDISLLAMPTPTSRYILSSPQVGWTNTPWRSGPASDFQLEFIEVFS